MIDAKVRYSPTGSTSSSIFDNDMLLEKVQHASIAMLRAATAAMGMRRPEVGVCLTDLGGACVAYNGRDVPLTCAIGVGTSTAPDPSDIEAIEAFYSSRNSPVRITISGRTHTAVNSLLASRGYKAGTPMENWWRPLADFPAKTAADDIQVTPAAVDEADVWVRNGGRGLPGIRRTSRRFEITSKTARHFLLLRIRRWRAAVPGTAKRGCGGRRCSPHQRRHGASAHHQLSICASPQRRTNCSAEHTLATGC